MVSNNENILFQVCCTTNNTDDIEYLINEKKMDIKQTDLNGNTCLLLACKYNKNLRIIKYLISKHKLDPNIENKQGENCLMIAGQYNNSDIVSYLIIEKKMKISKLEGCKLSDVITKYLEKTGYMPFILKTYEHPITNIINKDRITNQELDYILEYILNNNLKGNILSYKILSKMSYEQLRILLANNIVANIHSPQYKLKKICNELTEIYKS